MRSWLSVDRAFATACCLCALTGIPASAAAQSLFETLFGATKPNYAAPNAYQGPHRLLPPGGANTGTPYGVRQMPQPSRNETEDDRSSAKAEQRGGYQTVCVRLCDGFYWPVSFSAPRSRFYRDANACSASCGSEAKLFHYPTHGGQIQDAVDLTGRIYGRLPSAFKYRKALVAGCACKPEPWSEAEKDRHRVYALDEEAEKPIGLHANSSKVAVYPVPQPSGAQASVIVGDASDASDADPQPRRGLAGSTDMVMPIRNGTRAVAPDPIGAVARVRNARVTPRFDKPRISAQPDKIQTTGGGFWGGGQSPKYTWPGDQPLRVR